MNNPSNCYYPHSSLFVNSMDDIEAECDELDDLTTAMTYQPLESAAGSTSNTSIPIRSSRLISYVAIPVENQQTTEFSSGLR